MFFFYKAEHTILSSMKIVCYSLLFSVGFAGGIISLPSKESQANLIKKNGQNKRPRFGMTNKTYFIPPPKNQEERDFWLKMNRLSANSNFQAEFSQLNLENLPISEKYVKYDYLFNRWAQYAPREAILSAQTIKPPFNRILSEKIFQIWGEKKPEELAQYYLENRNSLYGSTALESAIKSWAESAPEQAIKWLLPLSPKEQKNGIQSILDTLVDSNPSRIKEILSLVPTSQLDHPDLLSGIMQKWVAEDPATALDWMNSLSQKQKDTLSDYRNIPTSVSLNSLLSEGLSHPEDLIHELAVFPLALQIQAWKKVITTMSNEKGSIEASRWMEENLSREIGAIVYSNTKENPASPEEFKEKIAKLPPGDTHDQGLSDYIRRYSSNNYEETISYLNSINEPEFIQTVLKNWAYNDPQKAEAWLNNSSFSEKEKQEIIKSFEKPSFIIPAKND